MCALSVAGWYDLTRPIVSGMPVYPGDPPVRTELWDDYTVAGFRTTLWHLGSHTGTHVDAPRHFIAGGGGVDQLMPDVLLGPAHIADVRAACGEAEITAADLTPALPCERLLLCTGWDTRWGDDGYYADMPGLAEDAAHALVAAGVRLVGMDTPNIHAQKWARLHQLLLNSGVVLVEGLCGLTRLLPAKTAYLVVAPLLIVGGDGAPARVFVRIGDNTPEADSPVTME